ncbi:thioredoxin TrxC [Vibrio ostreicida]|uniref:thioredoxin TrxC n=1 Tax=Vibrio ostreicida TaxID=526588 RepID=UPI0009707A0D|nr:thioredoxin TrxC [Vibrio ostreicida]
MTTFNTRCPSCSGVNRVPIKRASETPKCGKCQSPLLDNGPIEGTLQNFDAILTSKQPVVVDFWASWCNPCVGFAPIFSDVSHERRHQIRFVKVDTENQQALAAKYQIRSLPTLMIFEEGKRIDSVSGALPKGQFEQWLNQAINK